MRVLPASLTRRLLVQLPLAALPALVPQPAAARMRPQSASAAQAGGGARAPTQVGSRLARPTTATRVR